jgi:hypothetical protein
MNHTNSYSIMASYLLKLSVCYFNEPLLKDKSNTIGDNLASHNTQQVVIYNTQQHIEVFRVFICSNDFYKFLHQNHNL